jgi:hypothetical protein
VVLLVATHISPTRFHRREGVSVMADVQPRRSRRFHLQRDYDVTGASGAGRVAEGCLWPDGTANVHWSGERWSNVFWPSIEFAEAVHGHGGATRIVWDDE